MPKSDPPPGGADRILAAYDRAISAHLVAVRLSA